MAESFVPLSGFSTPDADPPQIAYSDGDLSVTFTDWREQSVALRFPDAVAFRWQDNAALPPDVRDDCSYEVTDSAWIAELCCLNSLPREPHHYMLCFNAAGVLQVVSGRVTVET
jgi:hypothetical protein